MSDMVLKSLSEYIIANAPMTNLPELLSLHHGNPLGLHPIVIPLFLLVMAAAMHITTQRINKYDKRSLYPLLHILLGVAVLLTYYYCFSNDLPLFEDRDLHRKEISVGWFCQKDIVGLGWSLLGELLLTYIVFCFLTALVQVVAHLSDTMGMAEQQWIEWQSVIFVMLLGVSIAGVADVFAPIAGVWIMIVYQTLMVLTIVVKTIIDMVKTHKVWPCLLIAICFLIGIEAVTMLAIECIEGNIYFFIPVVFILTTVNFRYKKKQNTL